MNKETTPLYRLLVFPHSHYCEKARWALDYKGIPFEEVTLLPGFHMRQVRKIAPDTSVPVLMTPERVIQGSGEIIDYLDHNTLSPSLTPLDPQQRRACNELESNMDYRLGENIRRILYATLLAYPDFIRYCFTHSLPRVKQVIFSLIYPLLRKKIYRVYVISPAAVDHARREFDKAMHELETMLGQNPYLMGEHFSRADVCVASMLSFLAMPAEHPFPWIDLPDPAANAFYEQYRQHPVIHYVSKMYRDHRLVATA